MTAKARAKPVNRAVSKEINIAGDIQISLAPPSTKKSKSASVKRDRVATMVKFGSVTVHVLTPHKNEVQRNIKAGQSALARARTRLVRSGVKIDVPRGVPLFHANPVRPDQLVREIDGKLDYGVFVNGKFETSR